MFYQEILIPLIQQVEKSGDNRAFCINDQYYTYREFATVVSRIRKTLKTKNIEGKHIGLISNNDIETYASIFAIWLEGGAYVPLNPYQPVERNLEIISQADVFLIIDSSPIITFPNINTFESKKTVFEEIDLSIKEVPNDYLAYILFTSGSTGKPKGVAISRSNIASFVKTYWDNGYKIHQNDRSLQPFDLSFDLSIMSFLLPIIKGASIYTVSQNSVKFTQIIELLEKYSITMVIMVPSTIRYLKPYFEEIELPNLRYNQFCGEGLEADLIEQWSKCVPNSIIENIYGPTENTVVCSYYRYNREGNNKSYNGILSIGKPMVSEQMVIVNEDGHELRQGEKGELCVHGNQLMSGYWNNPEKNLEAFFIDKHGKRLYKTGDICYKDEDGHFMYCGRKDFQVKVQGYRVELGEIEFHAKKHLKDINLVATGFKNKTGNSEIALFIEHEEIDSANLLAQLKNSIPNYMIPTQIIYQPVFPLNSNGKIDRNALQKLLKN
jgi:amino acid adenylation domain-containing protein